MVQFVLLITTDSTKADTLDPYILVAKTLMIFGLLLSIYLRIESTNGNLHTEVEILTTSYEFRHLLTTDGYEVNSLDRSSSQKVLHNASVHFPPNASIFKQQQVNADVSTVIEQRAKAQKT